MNEEAFKKLASYTLELAKKIRKLEMDNLEIKNAILHHAVYSGYQEESSLRKLLFKD